MASYAVPYGVSEEDMAKAMGDASPEVEAAPTPEPEAKPEQRRRAVKAES
jgi:hypothetical protein